MSADSDPIWVTDPSRGASPRHVPDEIIAVPAIPHTRTGKKLEIPVKRILQGADPRQDIEAGAVDTPDALRWFAAYQRGMPTR